ncbi:hypothetical protein PF008_g17345 [Phytophthora fragariae]|uniref:PH domain-containing protein n=1 Tax=Phytophthora fragariae TaxID=53985 RepID=A0A6G0R8J8_9STRA|nr:hypothetical protein PF008_g17345 [Phytophthora fragariae]
MSDGQILRTGVLFKKGSGTGPFGRKNWKPRYFVLTPARLQYFTFEDGELKGELSLQGCDEGVLEVMPADSMKTGSSASTIWRVAINAPERRLLVAAGTEMEMNDWVDKLVLAFRINSGQPPLQRASMPAPTSDDNIGFGGRAAAASIPSVNSKPSIRDFQNFSVPRRGLNQRHSVGADMRPSVEEQEMQLQLAQAESVKQQQLEEVRRLEEDQRQEEIRHEQQLRRQEEQDAEMRRQLAAQQEQELERQQEEEALDAALAAAEELQRQEEQEKRAQNERERQQEMELQRAREAEEAARLQAEQEQQAIRNARLARELAVQEKLKPQQGEDLLELQRRQKREEHARERAEREKALKLKQEQEQDLAFRMTQQMNSHFSVDDESDDSDYEPEASPSSPVVESGPIGSGGLDDAASAHSPATAPRSSLVGDAKREMIQKQQLEHQRRREAALKQEQQERDAEWRQQQVEMEQQRVKMAAVNVREAPREVEVAPREIEVVRRAPVKKPTPVESFEF